MNRNRRNSDLPEQWFQLPALRRHVYFYTLLLLGTLAISALSDVWRYSNDAKKRIRKPRLEETIVSVEIDKSPQIYS